MQEELVSFQVAKLAKEKGFGIPYPAFFHIENGKITEYNYVYTDILTSQFHDIREGGNLKSTVYFSRPTQSLLQKWLREVHNIDCRVASNSLTYHFPMNSILEEDGTQMCGPKILIRYNTYEEALEVGLYEALKLIPNVNSGN